MEDASVDSRPKKRRLGCGIFGWALIGCLIALALFLSYRVWFYYSKLKSGEIVELPQFQGRLTRSGSGAAAPAAPVDLTLLEDKDAPTLGAQDAKLTIVEFADFECPYSKEASLTVRSLLARYGDRVRFIYRDFPIESVNPDAFQAAAAAECAREQDKFWQYHDKLYANAPALKFQNLAQYAAEAGLDRSRFEECLIANRYKDKVEADIAAAGLLGVQGTPTFFVNGERISGAIPEDAFERIIQRLTR